MDCLWEAAVVAHGLMARPVRIEVPGGWYHVTARGNERKPIYWDDRDRLHFLELLEWWPTGDECLKGNLRGRSVNR
jgi:hypothetical protein